MMTPTASDDFWRLTCLSEASKLKTSAAAICGGTPGFPRWEGKLLDLLFDAPGLYRFCNFSRVPSTARTRIHVLFAAMIGNIEDYFAKGCGRCERFATPDCSTRKWENGLKNLRRICLDSGLVETVKWGHPCYMHAGRNIAVIGAFRGDFRISFFRAALLRDTSGALERQGPNSRYPDMVRFTDNSRVAKLEPVVRSFLMEAMGYAEAGITPPKEQGDIELPDELLEALETDPELAEAFHNLTPGRQKSYVINLNSAKKSETRISRIAKFRDKIFAGKGALEM